MASNTYGCITVDFETINCEEMVKYLAKRRISKRVIQIFQEERICGSMFLSMTPTDIAEMLPGLTGERLKLKNLLQHVRVDLSFARHYFV